jgi:hypothetical protein
MNALTAEWANFFVAEVGASAALSGLVVVAISINLSRILSFPQLPGRAAEALIILVGVLVLTSIGLIPNQPMAVFGWEVLAIGATIFVIPLMIQLRSLKSSKDLPAKAKYLRIAMSAVASLPIMVGGAVLISGFGSGVYWLAAGVIAGLVAGVWDAWVLLIEILR